MVLSVLREAATEPEAALRCGVRSKILKREEEQKEEEMDKGNYKRQLKGSKAAHAQGPKISPWHKELLA